MDTDDSPCKAICWLPVHLEDPVPPFWLSFAPLNQLHALGHR